MRPVDSQTKPILLVLKPLAVFAVIASLLLFGPGVVSALGNMPTLSCMMLGAFIIHLSARPEPRELVITIFLAAIFRTAYSVLGPGFVSYFGSILIHWGGFLGSASLVVLFARAWRCVDETRKARWDVFLTASTLPYTWVIVAMCLGFLAKTPRTNDVMLCAFDASLGMLPSFSLGAILARHRLLHDLIQTAYNALPLGAAFLLAAYRRSSVKRVRIIPLYVTMMVSGFIIYWLYPAAGPAFAYADRFPLDPPPAHQILGEALAPFSAPRNAMPSLHFGAMLVLMWNSRNWRWPARAAALCFSLSIAFATIALGEHYLIDLVVAFPFIAAVQAAWTTAVPFRSPRRYLPFVAGLTMLAGWLVALKFAVPTFMQNPWLGWCSTLITIGIAVGLEWNLARALPAAKPREAPQRFGLAAMSSSMLISSVG